MMYEHKSKPMVPFRAFARRQFLHAAFAGGMVLLALALGTIGYKFFEARSWLDSEYSAAMILTGMGPAFEMKSEAGKVFASVYAIFSGVVFLTSASVLVAPFLHRLLHKLHLDADHLSDE